MQSCLSSEYQQERGCQNKWAWDVLMIQEIWFSGDGDCRTIWPPMNADSRGWT